MHSQSSDTTLPALVQQTPAAEAQQRVHRDSSSTNEFIFPNLAGTPSIRDATPLPEGHLLSTPERHRAVLRPGTSSSLAHGFGGQSSAGHGIGAQSSPEHDRSPPAASRNSNNHDSERPRPPALVFGHGRHQSSTSPPITPITPLKPRPLILPTEGRPQSSGGPRWNPAAESASFSGLGLLVRPSTGDSSEQQHRYQSTSPVLEEAVDDSDLLPPAEAQSTESESAEGQGLGQSFSLASFRNPWNSPHLLNTPKPGATDDDPWGAERVEQAFREPIEAPRRSASESTGLSGHADVRPHVKTSSSDSEDNAFISALFPNISRQSRQVARSREASQALSFPEPLPPPPQAEEESSSGHIGFAYHSTPSAPVKGIPHVLLSADDFMDAIAMMQVDDATGAAAARKRESTSSARRYAGLVITTFLLAFWPAIFYAFEGTYLYHTYNPAVVFAPIYLFLGTFVNFLVVLLRDPGRLPKRIDPSPPMQQKENAISALPTPVDSQVDLDLSPNRRRFFDQIRRTKAEGVLPRGIQLPNHTTVRAWQANMPDRYTGGSAPPKRARLRAVPLERAGVPTWLVYDGRRGNLTTPLQKLTQGARVWERKGEKQPRFLFPTMTSTHRMVPPRDVRVGEQVLRTRWCGDCELYPPPRAHHCYICGHCTQDFHFHSRWLGRDIAARNILPFTAFLIFAALTFVYCAVFSALQLVELSRLAPSSPLPPGIFFTHRQGSFVGALSMAPFAAVLFAGGSILVLFLLRRLAILLGWAITGQTGLQRRSRRVISAKLLVKRPRNPFHRGSMRRNASSILCLPWHVPAVDGDTMPAARYGAQQAAPSDSSGIQEVVITGTAS